MNLVRPSLAHLPSYAAALRQLLPRCREQGLSYIELRARPSNAASQRVITANGGEFVCSFEKPASHGGGEGWLYRIAL